MSARNRTGSRRPTERYRDRRAARPPTYGQVGGPLWESPSLRAPKPGFWRADVLGRTQIKPTGVYTPRVVATVASAGYGEWLDDLLGSIQSRGCVDDALLVVVIVGDAPDIEFVCAHYARQRPLLTIQAQPLVPVTAAVKAALYSITRWVEADYYVLLEADMVVLRTLAPLFEMLEETDARTILGVRPCDVAGLVDSSSWLVRCCEAAPEDAARLLGGGDETTGREVLARRGSEMRFLNGGLIAGTKAALLALDAQLSGMMPFASKWIEEAPPSCAWRDEHVYNVALHNVAAGHELSLGWNAALHVHALGNSMETRGDGPFFNAQLGPEFGGEVVNILHFSNDAKTRHAKWRGHFAQLLTTTGGP